MQECQGICKDTSTCEYFSWDGTALDKNCVLFKDAAKPKESSHDGYYSGPKNCRKYMCVLDN